MLKRIKELIRENRRNQKNIINYSREINWANIYHDSIRGKEWLENQPLNVGRWAGNYVFFYLLNRILADLRPHSILELGIGESTKFISAYLSNELKTTSHIVVEENRDWEKKIKKQANLNERISVRIMEVNEYEVKKGVYVNCYKGFEQLLNRKYDLYIIDGPIGSRALSRYDMVKIGKSLERTDDFLVIIDDYEREGERQSVKEFLKILNTKKIPYHTAVYYSLKQVLLIASEKYYQIRSF